MLIILLTSRSQAQYFTDLRAMLTACEERISNSLIAVLHSRDAKRAALLLEGARAQSFLDAVQDVRRSIPRLGSHSTAAGSRPGGAECCICVASTAADHTTVRGPRTAPVLAFHHWRLGPRRVPDVLWRVRGRLSRIVQRWHGCPEAHQEVSRKRRCPAESSGMYRTTACYSGIVLLIVFGSASLPRGAHLAEAAP
jgi:hypothetical protein